MKCDSVCMHICDNLDEDINSPRCRAIRAHLEECPSCRAYLDSMKKTITLFRAMPDPPVPAVTHRELFKTISALTGQLERPVRKQRRPMKKK